jgi:hypothetical protein
MTTRTLGRRPVPWPFRLLGWFVLASTLLVLLALAALAGTVSYYEVTRTSDGDVRGMIEEGLREGATTNQVLSFLDSHDIEHGPVEPVDLQNRRLWDAYPQSGWMSVSGFVRNDGYSLKLVDVEMIFVLDETGRLKDYVVYEVSR